MVPKPDREVKRVNLVDLVDLDFVTSLDSTCVVLGYVRDIRGIGNIFHLFIKRRIQSYGGRLY